MATQTRSNSFRARTRLKSARSGASRRLGTAKHCSGPLKTSSRQLQDDFGTTSESSRDRKTLLRTAQDHSKPARGNFRTTSGPLRSRLRASIQTVKQRSAELLKTSLGPAQGRSWVSRPQNTVQNRSKPAPSQLETPLSTAQNQLEASSRPAQTSAKLTSARTVHGMHGHTLV